MFWANRVYVYHFTVDLITHLSAPECAYNKNNLTSNSNIKVDKLKDFGFDLNLEDVSSTGNHDVICTNEHIQHLMLRDEFVRSFVLFKDISKKKVMYNQSAYY